MSQHDELLHALSELSEAHGASALASAHARLQSAVRRKRQKKSGALSPLADAIEECLVIRDQMKTSGVTGEELNRGMEAVLREHWPRQRTEPWHYTCENCQDYGGEILECPAVPCERTNPHGPHSYLRPCYCKNRRFDTTPRPPAEGDALERAAKPTKPTRWGRS